MSTLLISLLKNSILPAALIVVAKFSGLYLSITLFNIDAKILHETNGIFSVQLYIPSFEDMVYVNSISNISMLFILISGYLYVLTKYVLYAKSQNDPKTIVKLTKFNLIKWVTHKDNVFIRVFSWSIFSLAAIAITITQSINGSTYEWIGLLGFSWAIFILWSLIRTFEIETAKIYPRDNKNYY